MQLKPAIFNVIACLTVLTILTVSCQAQTAVPEWVQRYSHPVDSVDRAVKVLTDAAGNCITVGYCDSALSGKDWLMIKYSAGGVPLWTNRFNGTANQDDYVADAVLDSEGNLLVTGYSYSDTPPTSSCYVTLKYSAAGQPLWTNQYRGTMTGHNIAHKLAVAANGMTMVLGDSSNGSNDDYATIAYSSAGVPLWTNRYNGLANGNEDAADIAVDSSRNVFVTGTSKEANSDFTTIAYSEAGVPFWTNRFNGAANGNDTARSIGVDAAGNVIVTGSSQLDNGSYGAVTLAYSNAGGPLWTNLCASPTATEQYRPISMVTKADGSIFVMVSTPDSALAGFSDYLTIAYSNLGIPLWTNRYDGANNANDLVIAGGVDSAGNLFVSGRSANGATNKIVTLAYAPDGTPIWTNDYSGPFNRSVSCESLAVDSGGNVFVAATLDGPVYDDRVTIKYSGTGVALWTNVQATLGNANDLPTALAVDGAGRVFVTGYSMSSGSGYDYATIAYASSGIALWTNRYNGPGNGNDYATNMVVNAAGQLFVTGASMGTNGYSDYATIAYANDGVPLWTNRFNGATNANAGGTALAITSTGKIVVTGYSAGKGTGADQVTIGYSNLGVALWTNRINGTYNNNDYPAAICADNDGNVIVTGYVQMSSGGNDFSTVKYSDEGTQLWWNHFNSPANQSDKANAVAVDRNGTVFVTGGSYNGFATVCTTIAYSSTGTPLWTNYTGAGSGNAIVMDAQTNVIMTGTVDVHYAHSFQTIKFSNAGVPQWTNIYTGPSGILREALAVAVDANDAVIVTGYSPTNSGPEGFLTIAYSSAGVPLWTHYFHGPADGNNYPTTQRCLAVGPDGSIYVAGASDGNLSSGSTSDFAMVKYATWPSFRQPLGNQVVIASGTARFDAAGYGTGPLAYQWYCNGQLMPGATNEFLVISPVDPTDQGNYQVTISSPFGSATGALASLTIALPPQLRLIPWTEGSFKLSVTGTSNLNGRVEVSSNLWQWVGVTNFNSPTGRFELIDSNGPDRQRFYRALYVP